MSFQAPISIADAIANIEQRRYLLPAIQREFVWPSEKIEWLFDSLMRGYPISSFLFWDVEDLSTSGYRFYEFIREFRERFKIHNEEVEVAGIGNFTAVLDGQQRLTSLYIGLKGSYAYKNHKYNWVDIERNIPTRRLYLNILHRLEDQEDDRVFEFRFLKDSETEQADLHDSKWFRVGKINDLRNYATFNNYVNGLDLEDFGKNTLARLQEVIFGDRMINFFLEKEQDLHKALNIFIRINSGGQPLDFSDLIMSIAVANWKSKDARKEIHDLVDSVRELGFSVGKDFIFKAYLYLYSSDIKFKVTNFSAENAHNFEQEWEKIRDAIYDTFSLFRSFGYEDTTLTSKNAAIPIIYYLYHRGIYAEFETRVAYRDDRDAVRKWLHVMLVKRVFGAGGADGTLSQIRKAFTDDVTEGPKLDPELVEFPARKINEQLKRDTSVGPEFIDELLKTQKENRYAFAILALLSPQLDYRNGDFHMDHLHPISAFTDNAIAELSLDEAAKAKFNSWEWCNSIINLQMLNSNENQSKQDKPLADWVKVEIERNGGDETRVRDRCIIPLDASLEFKDFATFAESRRELLAEKLTTILR